MLLRETTASGQAKKKKAKEAASKFEKTAKGGEAEDQGVKIIEGSWALMFIALAVVVASALWANLAGGAKWVAYVLALVGWGLTFFLGTIRLFVRAFSDLSGRPSHVSGSRDQCTGCTRGYDRIHIQLYGRKRRPCTMGVHWC